MRDTAIHLRAHAEQRDLIDRAASVASKTRSEFMLDAACEKARDMLLDRVFFQLDVKSFARFRALLDAAPVENPALARLLNTVSPWEAAAPGRRLAVHEPIEPVYATRRKKAR